MGNRQNLSQFVAHLIFSEGTPPNLQKESCTIGTLQEDIDELADKFVSQGDVLAGINVILEIVGWFSVLGATLAGLAALVSVAPWTAPFLTPIVLIKLFNHVSNTYVNLPSHKRAVVAAAVGWMTGQVKIK